MVQIKISDAKHTDISGKGDHSVFFSEQDTVTVQGTFRDTKKGNLLIIVSEKGCFAFQYVACS